MKMISVKYENGPANGICSMVTDNTLVVFYGPKGKEEIYQRTNEFDSKGRVIFHLKSDVDSYYEQTS